MLYARIMVMWQIVDHFVGSQRVSGEDDMLISFFACPGQISINIFIRVRETLVPGTDDFFLSGINIYGFNLPEGIIGLGIDEVDIAAIYTC